MKSYYASLVDGCSLAKHAGTSWGAAMPVSLRRNCTAVHGEVRDSLLHTSARHLATLSSKYGRQRSPPIYPLEGTEEHTQIRTS